MTPFRVEAAPRPAAVPRLPRSSVSNGMLTTQSPETRIFFFSLDVQACWVGRPEPAASTGCPTTRRLTVQRLSRADRLSSERREAGARPYGSRRATGDRRRPSARPGSLDYFVDGAAASSSRSADASRAPGLVHHLADGRCSRPRWRSASTPWRPRDRGCRRTSPCALLPALDRRLWPLGPSGRPRAAASGSRQAGLWLRRVVPDHGLPGYFGVRPRAPGQICSVRERSGSPLKAVVRRY